MEDQEFTIDKLDFDSIHDEAVAEDRYGECNLCESRQLLCWCGVCLKYCHSDYFHEEIDYRDDLP